MIKWTHCKTVPRRDFERLKDDVFIWAKSCGVCPDAEIDFFLKVFELYLNSEYTSDRQYVYLDTMILNVVWSMYLHFCHSRSEVAQMLANDFLDALRVPAAF